MITYLVASISRTIPYLNIVPDNIYIQSIAVYSSLILWAILYHMVFEMIYITITL